MPAFIKNPRDEKQWAKAKKAAGKTLSEKDGDSYWALTNHIYQKMNKAESLEVIKSLLEKARGRLSDEHVPEDEEPSDSDNEGLTEFDPDQQPADEAEEWLRQNDPKKGKKNEKATQQSKGAVESGGVGDGMEEAAAEKGGKAPQEKVKLKELDPERLRALKAVAPHWLSHADQMKKQTANARSNPHLFAEGHRQAAHNTAHEDFNTAYHAFINGDEYKTLSPTQKMRAEIKFKKEFQDKNPDYHKNAINAVSEAHKMHDKAKDLHEKEMNARKAHILSGGASGGETMSAAEAAQHVGGAKNDEGEYSTSTVKDPAAVFASQYGQHLMGEAKPKVTESEEHETLDNPEKKIIKHPSLEDPKNKQLIDDFFKEHHPLIMRAAHRARSQAIDNGMPEDKIDISDLHEAGMHGLMQAINDYSPDVGSFRTHANSKMQGLMQSKLASQDYIPRELRSKMSLKEKGVLASGEQPSEAVSVPTEAPSTAAAPVPSQPEAPASPTPAPVQEKPKADLQGVIASSGHKNAADMADRLKRADAHRSVIIRKKGE